MLLLLYNNIKGGISYNGLRVCEALSEANGLGER